MGQCFLDSHVEVEVTWDIMGQCRLNKGWNRKVEYLQRSYTCSGNFPFDSHVLSQYNQLNKKFWLNGNCPRF